MKDLLKRHLEEKNKLVRDGLSIGENGNRGETGEFVKKVLEIVGRELVMMLRKVF